jgi:thiol-disulfide isomerase/thioredoxin
MLKHFLVVCRQVLGRRVRDLATLCLVPLLLGSLAAAAAPPTRSDALTGRWAATAEVAGAQIPFRLDLVRQGDHVQATFFDGARPTNPSTSGDFKNGQLHLVFAGYAATLDATVQAGRLEGAYTVSGHAAVPIHAVRGAAGPSTAAGPPIRGEWIIPYASPKGESAWRLIVKQGKSGTEAAILRIDGDTGTLNGGWVDGAYRLSHFAGERAALLEARPQADGSLQLVLIDGGGRKELRALRSDKALAAGVAPPDDPTRHTGVHDPKAPFRFAFPDLAGKVVADTDPRFRGKVVVIDIMGSWCPNCHDEAPFLEALYRKHAREGLEIVALDFEQPAQLSDPARLRAFIKQAGLTYTVLLAGEPKEIAAKLPQIDHFDAWPTTFFVGRDGRVKAVHVGFTSPGSGPRDIETRAEVEHTVERLLAERR